MQLNLTIHELENKSSLSEEEENKLSEKRKQLQNLQNQIFRLRNSFGEYVQFQNADINVLQDLREGGSLSRKVINRRIEETIQSTKENLKQPQDDIPLVRLFDFYASNLPAISRHVKLLSKDMVYRDKLVIFAEIYEFIKNRDYKFVFPNNDGHQNADDNQIDQLIELLKGIYKKYVNNLIENGITDYPLGIESLWLELWESPQAEATVLQTEGLDIFKTDESKVAEINIYPIKNRVYTKDNFYYSEIELINMNGNQSLEDNKKRVVIFEKIIDPDKPSNFIYRRIMSYEESKIKLDDGIKAHIHNDLSPERYVPLQIDEYNSQGYNYIFTNLRRYFLDNGQLSIEREVAIPYIITIENASEKQVEALENLPVRKIDDHRTIVPKSRSVTK